MNHRGSEAQRKGIGRASYPKTRHRRVCPGDPRLAARRPETWMRGTSPRMTAGESRGHGALTTVFGQADSRVTSPAMTIFGLAFAESVLLSASVANAILQRFMPQEPMRVGVIGLGYVGLPLAEAFASAGYPVLGLDIDPDKIRKLRTGQSYMGSIPSERIAELLTSGTFEATTEARACCSC